MADPIEHELDQFLREIEGDQDPKKEWALRSDAMCAKCGWSIRDGDNIIISDPIGGMRHAYHERCMDIYTARVI